jgi:hypothetical protein
MEFGILIGTNIIRECGEQDCPVSGVLHEPNELTITERIELIKQLCPEIVQYVELEFIIDTAESNPYTRKELLKLPIETRREILRKQVDNYLTSLT